MAEYCLKCFNEMNDTNYHANQVWLEEDFCEGCGEWQLCIVMLRPKPLLQQLKDGLHSMVKSKTNKG